MSFEAGGKIERAAKPNAPASGPGEPLRAGSSEKPAGPEKKKRLDAFINTIVFYGGGLRAIKKAYYHNDHELARDIADRFQSDLIREYENYEPDQSDPFDSWILKQIDEMKRGVRLLQNSELPTSDKDYPRWLAKQLVASGEHAAYASLTRRPVSKEAADHVRRIVREKTEAMRNKTEEGHH
jgi:hypothetical protein